MSFVKENPAAMGVAGGAELRRKLSSTDAQNVAPSAWSVNGRDASATAFTRDKFAWLSQIAHDATLPPTAARLAIILSRYVNRETGDAWPSVTRLARELRVAENSIRSALKAMSAAGHLAIKFGGGAKIPNHYHPILKPCTQLKGFQDETLQSADPNPSIFGAKTLQPAEGEPLYENPNKNPVKDNNTTSAKKPKAASGKILEILGAALSRETCDDLIEHRKKLRKPMTVGAAKGLVREFTAYGDAEAAAREMMVRGWRGFRAEWMKSKSQRATTGSFLETALAQIAAEGEA